MGKDDNSIFLQTPGLLGILTPPKNPPVKRRFGYYITVDAFLPSDVYIKILISNTFLVVPFQDSIVRLIRPTEPVQNSFNKLIHLRQLDPEATSLNPSHTYWLPFGTINSDNFFLFGYHAGAGTDI